MKIYQVVLVENPGRGFSGTATVSIIGNTLNALPLAEARGVGTGEDPAQAAEDAITAATLALPHEMSTAARQAALRGVHD